jgi:hypothetical protein
MRPSKHFQELAHCCNHLASEISDDNGFISVKRLVERFRARLVIRPLLVEGMLASSESRSNQKDNKHQWSLIIDKEIHNFSDEDISNEKFGSPLTPRFRNTVAHELAHSLAFRPTEFGVQFPKLFKSEQSKRDFVEKIESETEKLSPLLLIPDSLLDQIFAKEKDRITIEELCRVKSSIGISRSVIINRINLLSFSDKNKLKAHRSSLHNLAIGIGEWKSKSEAVFKPFPLYSNFRGGRSPGFILKLERQMETLTKNIIFDPTFVLNGGELNTVDCVVPAGTSQSPDSTKMPIRCSIEKGTPKAGTEFLFIVQSLS